MMDEGRRLVDAARTAGLTLRLLGGLAVREHCRTAELCERDYSDLDMVGRAKQARGLVELFISFGYAENFEVSTATANAELQFVRPCVHGGAPGAGPAHADDHVDVFLDTFRMDHDITLGRRLEIEPYTVSLSDLLLTKLQIFRLEEKDLDDIVTLLGDVGVGEEDAPRSIDSRYIGALCADDWGLFYDVATNLKRVDDGAGVFDLSDVQVARVRSGVVRPYRRHRRRAQERALAPAGPRRHAQEVAQRDRRPEVMLGASEGWSPCAAKCHASAEATVSSMCRGVPSSA